VNVCNEHQQNYVSKSEFPEWHPLASVWCCQHSHVASAWKKRVDFFSLDSNFHLLLVELLKGRGNRHPVKCFAQGQNKRTCWLDFHATLMLNAKQRSVKETNFGKLFGMT